jgi:hypothetical protein
MALGSFFFFIGSPRITARPERRTNFTAYHARQADEHVEIRRAQGTLSDCHAAPRLSG